MDPKHTMGIDLAADGTTTVLGHWEDGVFHVDSVNHPRRDQLREALRRMTTKEMLEAIERQIRRKTPGVRVFLNHEDVTDQVLYPLDGVIEGTAVRVEKDPARLLDAGGSEP